jgi:hypothetical protein
LPLACQWVEIWNMQMKSRLAEHLKAAGATTPKYLNIQDVYVS